MAEDKKKGSDFALPSTGMLAVALAVIGLIWSGPAPLIDERPISHMASDNDKGQIQDIDARLWQDPLGAIEKGSKKTLSQQRSVRFEQKQNNELKLVIQNDASPENDEHSPKNISSKAFNNNGELPVESLQMLAVMIPGGPYPEEEEGRRRSRYAVLSALATLDYTPEDSEHIGYFKASSPTHPSLPDEVPFEFFEKENEAKTSRKRIFVLWLDDSKFDKNVDERVNAIFKLVEPHNIKSIIRSVIGPNKSNHLKTILKEANNNDVSPNGITYFAAGATVSDARATGNSNKVGPTDAYHPAPHLWRTIANDAMVSKALVTELKLRQVNSTSDRVLLISEWDTFYGQAFPETFTHVYMDNYEAECLPMTSNIKSSEGDSRSNVFCINYMRGIDGLLPDETTRNNEPAQEAQKKPETIQINNNIDRPSGNYQQDYLRRLVDRVRKLDQIIRDRTLPCPVKNNGISAIGVVGTDVYDKLMILQALRPYFPGKLFFTTDLDAAYFSDREQQFTHNLIVGSSFGLTLAPALQKSIPPFRDSYQTSMFLSTKLATSMWERHTLEKGNSENENVDITPNISKWLAAPRIFEIGRKNPVDLSPEDSGHADLNQKNDSDKAGNCQRDILDCTHIYPTPDINSRTHTSGSVLVLKLTSLILSLLLLYRMNWMARHISDNLKTKLLGLMGISEPKKCPGKSDLLSMSLFVTAGMIFVAAAYLFVDILGKEEPLSWVGGVSIWPSNLLQLAALILSLLALKALMQRMAKTDNEMRDAFLKPHSTADESKHPTISMLECVLAVHKWEAVLAEDKLDVEKLWKRYVEYGKTKYRIMRAAMGTTIFVLFGTAIIMLLGGQPVPSRGDFSFYTDVTLEILCVIFTVFLIMWIVDAARLSSRLISLIATDKPSKWPCIGESGWGWPQEFNDYIPYWLDVEFVARYTKALENFIWYPIPSLMLLGIARSTIFDNWTFSPGLLASIIILLVYLFSVAFILQHVAKTMRKKANEELEKKLRNLRGQAISNEQKNDPAGAAGTLKETAGKTASKEEISQLERMAEEIRSNERGAFTPFLRQPMIQALLAFLSGSGGAAILMERFF